MMGDYLLLNGTISASQIFESATGDVMDQTFSFSNFRIGMFDSAEALMAEMQFEGGARAKAVTSTSTVTGLTNFTYDLTGTYMGVNVVVGAEAVKLAYYNFSNHLESDGETVLVRHNVTVDGTMLQGSLNIRTLQGQDIIGSVYENYPDTGMIQVTGANGGWITIEILSPLSFDQGALNIEADVDGDGTKECSQKISWDQLNAGDWVCSLENPV